MRPIRLTLLALALTTPLGAQARLTAATEVRSAPDGNVVATLFSGTTWTTGATRGGFTSINLTGWVETSRLAGARDSFPQSIGGSTNWRIRAAGSLEGRILGEFRAGAGFRVLERRANWARIAREAWVPSAALERPAAAAPPAAAEPRATPASPPAASPAASTPRVPAPAAPESLPVPSAAPRGGALRAQAPASLRFAPSGAALGELEQGVTVEPLARERGWVKVRVEGWVAESLFVPTDTAFGATISAADLRLDPDGYRGRVVRWRVQVVGLQLADPLRRDLRPEEPFLLAMGPTGEDAVLYIAVPPSLLAEARTIPPLANVLLTARVRVGRSQPTGAPVLDLLAIVQR
jgi:hypothetical protein